MSDFSLTTFGESGELG